MTFDSPEYFVLLALFVYAAWQWPTLRLRQPLRALIVIVAVLLLADPQLQSKEGPLDLWVLVDQSASAKASLGPRLSEWELLLERSKPTRDEIFYIDFADQAEIRGEGDGKYFAEPRDGTRALLAARLALSRMDRRRSNRLLLLGDGYNTEPLTELVEPLANRRVALDYRLTVGEGVTDYRVSSFIVPERTFAGEPFLVELQLSGNSDGEVLYAISRDSETLRSGKVSVVRGRGVIRFVDRLENAQASKYSVVIQHPLDHHPGNNSSARWTEVSGKQSVLLITNYSTDPLERAIRRLGMDVVTVSPATGFSQLSRGTLTGKRSVILNNVLASLLPREFVEALPFYVSAQGGGLLMSGGRNSFGAGGYFGSALDPILPVSLELREEHRKRALAMALVLDRSGSMAAHVSGNMGNMCKMDLANEGAARSVMLLGERDELSVIAVDSSPHFVVPITRAAEDRGAVTSAIRSISVGGGGIYVYEGLKAGWQELSRSSLEQKHLVLFSDAADSEEPGAYLKLLEEMASAKGTVSVIGLGSEADPDAALLKDIAEKGGGRIFFVSNAVDLPAVFAQETVSVARSTFIDDPTPLNALPGWNELSVEPLSWVSQVDGYNLNYLKPEAGNAAVSADEYKAPLVAFWQRGLGRVGAVSFPLGGPFSERVRAWSDYEKFVQTLARYLAGEELPPGIMVRTEIIGTMVRLDLFHDGSWEGVISRSAPVLVLASSEREDEAMTPRWERVEPGHFRATFSLKGNEIVRGAVQIGKHALPFGPLNVSVSAEWAFDRARIRELEFVAKQSGGEERVDLSKVWEVPRQVQSVSLRLPLLVVLLLLFLIEALATRLGLRISVPAIELSSLRNTLRAWKPKLRRRDRAVAIEPPRQGREAEIASGERPKTPPLEETAKQPTTGSALRARFEKAKRRGRTT